MDSSYFYVIRNYSVFCTFNKIQQFIWSFSFCFQLNLTNFKTKYNIFDLAKCHVSKYFDPTELCRQHLSLS
jgi:hypothetical protein